MPLIDFKAVRKQIPLRRVLELLGYKPYRSVGHHGYGWCPFNCCSAPRACSFHWQKNVWRCHRCKHAGNSLELWAFANKMPIYEATLFLCDKAGIEVPRLV